MFEDRPLKARRTGILDASHAELVRDGKRVSLECKRCGCRTESRAPEDIWAFKMTHTRCRPRST